MYDAIESVEKGGANAIVFIGIGKEFGEALDGMWWLEGEVCGQGCIYGRELVGD